MQLEPEKYRKTLNTSISIPCNVATDSQNAEIWIIDDDESVRRSLRRLLRAAGFRVETFASAEEFLTRDDRKSCRCLILDVRMPGTSGLELQEMLVALGSPVPVVFITAHEDRDVERRALREGAVAFLIKPFDEQALLDAVATALSVARAMPPERKPRA
jgi:FixJ family two-component response regulator